MKAQDPNQEETNTASDAADTKKNEAPKASTKKKKGAETFTGIAPHRALKELLMKILQGDQQEDEEA